MYMPKPWTLNQDMMESELAIFEQTGIEHQKKVQICSGLIALLYELLLCFEGDVLPEVYPVTSDNRARKWYTLVYSSNSFLLSTSVIDLALRGRYQEAGAIMRSFLENAAMLEYVDKNSTGLLSTFKSKKRVPSLKNALAYLAVNGQFPVGGPRKMISRFHDSAHANILERMRSWIMRDEDGSITGFHIHQYDSESFERICHHMIIPLLAAHQIMYSAFEEKINLNRNLDLWAKWQLAREIESILEQFPDLLLHTELRSSPRTRHEPT